MFDPGDSEPNERASDPVNQAREKGEEFRMHAELAAVFEGCRKFDARMVNGLNAALAREIQQTMAKLERAKLAETPIIKDEFTGEAANLLNLPAARSLSTNDYHIRRRPGETMIVRWLAGDEVEIYYQRLQAHFDAALAGFQEDERQSHAWKQDPKTLAYLEALDKVQVKLAERYLREVIREHRVFVLSTQAADELNINYLADYIMGVPVEEIVGAKSAPPSEPTEQDLAWFFKLFSLRGIVEDTERMCFFAFLQKTDGEV